MLAVRPSKGINGNGMMIKTKTGKLNSDRAIKKKNNFYADDSLVNDSS